MSDERPRSPSENAARVAAFIRALLLRDVGLSTLMDALFDARRYGLPDDDAAAHARALAVRLGFSDEREADQ